MTIINEARRAGGAAGPEINCNALDKPQFIDPKPARQAQIERNPHAVRKAKLELLREAVHEACGFIRLHAKACQTLAEAGDDAGLLHSLGRLTSYIKHAAKVGNELRDIRAEAPSNKEGGQ
jgi:hypothetical protein